ncbi:MAG TPA: FAD-binding oxidoreductase [Acidisphaera sp.]|nr:FAD-binding oxidoreductase [Acidisphaera sp.]
MDSHSFDVVIVGAGIAGATVGAHLAPTHRVALVEAEETAGYHSTGRSAALWFQNYGPSDVRTLTRLSRPFFEHPPAGFADVPLLHRRPVVFLAPEEQESELDALLADGIGLRELPVADVRAMVPALRPDYARRAAIEEDAFDMDVAAIHQGFLRMVRASGGVLSTRSRTGWIEARDGIWHVHATGGAVFHAPIVVDAAGAWGDVVAQQAEVRPLGLQPKRRTGAIIDPSPWEARDWPLLNDVDQTWYVRPEARTRLMVSPADETDTHPHDVQPDEMDVAVAVERMQQALDIDVRRIEHSWAGLRTFTPDGSLAFGFDTRMRGFFWCVGQGGYGIQTSPAAGKLIADMIAGRDPGEAASMLPALDPKRFG